jgi:hypothetical protein
MSHSSKQQVVGGRNEWADVNKKKENLETITVPVRHVDRQFIKVFPAFTEAILTAMRDKKLEGSGDLLFYFMHRAMRSMINGFEHEIKIEAATAEIMAATGKKRSTVLKNRDTLVKLGFLKQPRRGVQAYVLPPDFIYRGVLYKLRKKEAQQQKKEMAKALREMKALRPKKSGPEPPPPGQPKNEKK